MPTAATVSTNSVELIRNPLEVSSIRNGQISSHEDADGNDTKNSEYRQESLSISFHHPLQGELSHKEDGSFFSKISSLVSIRFCSSLDSNLSASEPSIKGRGLLLIRLLSDSSDGIFHHSLYVDLFHFDSFKFDLDIIKGLLLPFSVFEIVGHLFVCCDRGRKRRGDFD